MIFNRLGLSLRDAIQRALLPKSTIADLLPEPPQVEAQGFALTSPHNREQAAHTPLAVRLHQDRTDPELTPSPEVSFERHFKTLSRMKQERIYAESIEKARAFCRDVLKTRDKLIQKADELVDFPVAAVPVSDFDRINAYWAVMDKVLGKSEGPRFVIDAETDAFVFGIAKNYIFKNVPVIDFTTVIEFRRNSDDSHVNGFVLYGRGQIFLCKSDFESSLQKMRTSQFARTLWEYATHQAVDAVSSPDFDQAVKEWRHFTILTHEYGHILSFRDQQVEDQFFNPSLLWNGEKHHHPSFERFHLLAEVYPELYGVMDALIESRNDLFTLLSFAHYARNLSSSTSDNRARAHALISIFIRNVRLDHTNKRVLIDYEGLQRDVDRQKDFLYQLVKMYQELKEEKIEKWVNEGLTNFLLIRELVRAFGERKSKVDASTKPQVESVFRSQTMTSFGLGAVVPFYRIRRDLETVREEARRSSLADLSTDGRESQAKLEERIRQGLPRLTEELQAEFERADILAYVTKVVCQVARGSRRVDGISTTSLSSFILDINELMQIKARVENSRIVSKLLGQGVSQNEFGNYGSDQGSINSRDIWDALVNARFLNNQGIIQQKFDGVFEHFGLPMLPDWIRRNVFVHLQNQLKSFEKYKKDLLSLQEFQEYSERVVSIQRKYLSDENIRIMCSEISDAIVAATSTSSQRSG